MPPLRPLPHYRWQTTEDWWTELSDGVPVMIPRGFVFKPSVPRFLWALYPPIGPAILYASCLHDLIYSYYDMGFRVFTRKYADEQWYYFMRELGGSWFRTYTGYLAIRGLGWIYWYFRVI